MTSKLALRVGPEADLTESDMTDSPNETGSPKILLEVCSNGAEARLL